VNTADVVDAILIGVLLIGVIAGLVKGLVRQVTELIGVVVSFFVAMIFAGWLASLLQEHVGMPYSPSLVIGFLAIFVCGLIVFHYVALAVQKVVRMAFLGWLDRLCGAMVGLIVAMLVGSMLIAVTLELPIGKEVRRGVETSQLSLYLRPMAPWLFDTVLQFGPGDLSHERIFKRGGPI